MASANDKSAGESDAAINSILTPREQKMILFGLLSCEELPAINYQFVAARMGMSNPRSVSNAWAVIKKKIKEFDAATKAADDSGAPRVPTPGPGRKRKAAEAVAAGSGDEVATPTPDKRGRGKKAKTATPGKPSTPGDAAEMPDTPTKNPKTPGGRGRGRPPKKAAAATPAVKPEDDDVQELIKPEDVAELNSITIKKERSDSAEAHDEDTKVAVKVEVGAAEEQQEQDNNNKDGDDVGGDEEMDDAGCI